MIIVKDFVFRLDTANTTYLFQRTKFGHLEHLYYGALLNDAESPVVMGQKRTIPIGSSVLYDPSDDLYCLDTMFLEWSDNGRVDYRQSPTELKMPDGSFVRDFVYVSHEVIEGSLCMATLPTAYGGNRTLVVTLRDTTCNVTLDLYYTVFENTNIITRRGKLTNECEYPLSLRRMMSMAVDLPDENFRILTLDGGWIKEAHLHERPVAYGMTVNSSITGGSSNRHNPGFLLAGSDATQDQGNVYVLISYTAATIMVSWKKVIGTLSGYLWV